MSSVWMEKDYFARPKSQLRRHQVSPSYLGNDLVTIMSSDSLLVCEPSVVGLLESDTILNCFTVNSAWFYGHFKLTKETHCSHKMRIWFCGSCPVSWISSVTWQKMNPPKNATCLLSVRLLGWSDVWPHCRDAGARPWAVVAVLNRSPLPVYWSAIHWQHVVHLPACYLLTSGISMLIKSLTLTSRVFLSRSDRFILCQTLAFYFLAEP